jgi:hypothetical protein
MPVVLPRKYKHHHKYCLLIHDILADIMVTGEKYRLFDVRLKFNSTDETESIADKSGEELFEWLENNGYKLTVYEIYYKQIFVALLSDYCHFIFEALRASKRGKLSVTYSLLRKPLKENLFYFEWLLAYPREFISNFDSGAIQTLELSRNVNKEKKIDIIKSAMGNTIKKEFIPAEFIYEIRYKKSVEYGLERSWQKATHLITTFDSIKTDAKNFNFVFSGDREKKSQWSYLYFILPLLLFYSLQIIESIFLNIVDVDRRHHNFMRLKTIIGFIMCYNRPNVKDVYNKLNIDFTKLFKEKNYNCPFCKGIIDIAQIDLLKQIYEYSGIKCYKCNNVTGYN